MPKSLATSASLTILISIATLLNSPSSSHATIHIAGSGTTNPSKCYWKLFSRMEDQSKDALHLTYRAVGSSTGQFEFLGANNTGVGAYVPYSDFGSGDIPVPTETYDAFTAAGGEMLHLPFVLGAISLFHSVPGVPAGPGGLNLTSCQISKIFKREIRYWDDAEILADNPELEAKLPFSDYPIRVARRVKGSSSTSSVTKYLRAGCPSEWPEDLVGSKIAWPEETMRCQGSGGMTACIRDNPGALGYIDSGHGHDQGLVEIELKNKFGTWLSSKTAAEKGGIASAGTYAVTPPSAELNWGEVDLLNGDGVWTWPIVAMSYVYLRKDLTYLSDPATQSLLTYFARSLYDPAVISQCAEFGFTPVPQSIRDVALAGIDSVVVDPSAPVWKTETDTLKGGGQADYLFSEKRRGYAEYARGKIGDDVDALRARVALLERKLAVEEAGGGGGGGLMAAQANGGAGMLTDQEWSMIVAGVALGATSLVLWMGTVFFVFCKN